MLVDGAINDPKQIGKTQSSTTCKHQKDYNKSKAKKKKGNGKKKVKKRHFHHFQSINVRFYTDLKTFNQQYMVMLHLQNEKLVSHKRVRVVDLTKNDYSIYAIVKFHFNIFL